MDKRVNTNNHDFIFIENCFSSVLLSPEKSKGINLKKWIVSRNTTLRFGNEEPEKLIVLFFPELKAKYRIAHNTKVINQHLIIVSRGETISFGFDNPPNLIFYSVEVSLDWAKENLSTEQTQLIKQLIFSPQNLIIEIPITQLKIKELVGVLDDPDLGLSFGLLYVCNQIVLQILTELYIKPKEVEINISIDEIERLYGVRQKLLLSSTNPENIEQMAMTVGMSTTKFKTSFKKLFGQSPYSYFLSERMSKAKDLIINHKKTVAEVSAEFGYNHTSNFTKTFKKYTTELPSKISVQNQ